VADSGLPWTILRATQFYDYVLAGLRRLARLPVVPVPAGFLVQPIDPGEVAARLVELAPAHPTGRRTWDEFLTATLDPQNGLLDRH